MALLSIYDHKPCHRPKSNLAEMRFTPSALLTQKYMGQRLASCVFCGPEGKKYDR